jgi:hypothetical protein
MSAGEKCARAGAASAAAAEARGGKRFNTAFADALAALCAERSPDEQRSVLDLLQPIVTAMSPGEIVGGVGFAALRLLAPSPAQQQALVALFHAVNVDLETPGGVPAPITPARMGNWRTGALRYATDALTTMKAQLPGAGRAKKP